MGWPIGSWLGKAAKWVWKAVKDDLINDIIGELIKPENQAKMAAAQKELTNDGSGQQAGTS